MCWHLNLLILASGAILGEINTLGQCLMDQVRLVPLLLLQPLGCFAPASTRNIKSR